MTIPSPFESRKFSPRAIALVALVLVSVCGALIWLKTRPPEVELPLPAPAAPAAPVALSVPDAPPVSEQAQRDLFEALSSNVLVRRWLANGDPVHRWAVLIDNLAEGVTPRRELSFLAPGEKFSVQGSGTAEIIAPASYQRYDGLADAISLVDAVAFARLYRAVHRTLESTYRALGYPDASLDAVAEQALRRLEQAPLEMNPVVVEKRAHSWTFAEARLEALPAVEKHLLRMGPRNTKLVQEKAAQIRAALGWPGSPQVGRGSAR